MQLHEIKMERLEKLHNTVSLELGKHGCTRGEAVAACLSVIAAQEQGHTLTEESLWAFIEAASTWTVHFFGHDYKVSVN